MLSPTLALRCAQCQRPLALSDLRTAPTCPACGAAHGLPSAVVDSLALYERAIQQSIVDLMRAAPAPVPADTPAGPRLVDAPAPATSSPAAAVLSAGPRRADAPPSVLTTSYPDAAPPAPPTPVLAASAPAAAPVPAASPVEPSAPATPDAPISLPPSAVSTVAGEAVVAPLSLPPSAISTLRAEAPPEARLPNALAASNSSLLSVLSARSSAGLSDAPLLVAAVREPAPTDTQPVSPASKLADAVRLVLPDRPDAAAPEPEGRIPAAALAVARRALLARHADERRQQQVREGSLGLFFAAVLCALLVVAGLWYVAAPIALVALLLRLRREERGERFGAEVQRLADALAGDRLPTYDAIAAWFDAMWPAPVSPEAMWTSHLHGAVRCQVRGYAALVDVHLNEKTSAGVVYPPRITAYLAAVWPGRVPTLRASSPDLPASAQARLVRLRRAGYTVVADAHGGLILRVSEAIAQAARADITRLPALQVPIGELADLARELGGEPVAAP